MCYGSHGSVEHRWRAGEYGGASGRLPERLTALVARFTLRVKGGNTHEGGRGKSSPLTCLPFDEAEGSGFIARSTYKQVSYLVLDYPTKVPDRASSRRPGRGTGM